MLYNQTHSLLLHQKQKQRMTKKSKLLRIITMPLKVLGKARDLYMRSITGCATRTHYSSPGNASVHFPRSRSSSSIFSSSASSRRRNSDFTLDDDYSELIRAASVRSLGHKNEIDMLIHQELQQRQQNRLAMEARGGLPKSSSVGMTMAKIDEEVDEEGSFNNPKKGSDFLYPRSRSYAVTFTASKFH